MRKFYLALFAATVISCTSERTFSETDKAAIDEIRSDYVNGWLANDSYTVLSLFTSDATIIPSGLSPITGKQSIENYWFPNDSSTTTIHSYTIELLDLKGTDSMAYSLEKGILDFTYTKGDFSLTKQSISNASTVYKKGTNGDWKIVSRMWTSLKE